jgi:GT2 family glycosyltransferase
MTAATPMLSIVVATRDRLPYLRSCLDSLRAQRYPRERMELIVVDDGSTDGTGEYLRVVGAEPWIRVVSEPTARRYAARNVGIATATGELVAITDDDCTVADDWLASLAEAMQSSGADAVGGHIDAPGGALWVRYLAHMRALDPDLLPTGDPRFLATANACFRRTALERVGLLDVELATVGGEDVDLAFRMRRHGMRLAFAPQCRVSHWYRQDVREMLSRVYRAGATNRVLLEKHRHWEHWTARADTALAWILRRRASHRGFFEVPDPALRPWYGLISWLQQLCFLAGYANTSRASDVGRDGAGDLPARDRSERTRTLLAMLSDGAVPARDASSQAGAEMESLEIDALLAEVVPPDLDRSRPGVPDASLPPETRAAWTYHQRQRERAYLARNIAVLQRLASEERTMTPADIDACCHADGVDVKRFLAWYGSLPRDRDGELVDARRWRRLPKRAP